LPAEDSSDEAKSDTAPKEKVHTLKLIPPEHNVNALEGI
jgi:hypothetical protein